MMAVARARLTWSLREIRVRGRGELSHLTMRFFSLIVMVFLSVEGLRVGAGAVIWVSFVWVEVFLFFPFAETFIHIRGGTKEGVREVVDSLGRGLG
jgi:hypothetical protein